MTDPESIEKTPREVAAEFSTEHADLVLESSVHELLASAYGMLQAAVWASEKWPDGAPQDVLDYIEEVIWWGKQSLGDHADG